jgi:hypothetical protein
VADKKKTSDKQDLPDDIEDAVVVDGPTDESSEKPAQETSPDTPATDEATAVPDPDAPESEAPVSEDTESEKPESYETPETEQSTKPAAEAASDTSLAKAPATHEQVVVRKGGFVPMVLGGLVAAGIGFGLAHSGLLEGVPLPGSGAMQDSMDDITQRAEAQDNALSDLTGRVAALEEVPALESREIPDMAPMIEDITTQIGVLAQRLDALEARPVGGSGAGDEDAQAALEQTRQELGEIRQALAGQREELALLTAQAAREEEAAQLTARTAMQRAALTSIQTAVDTGTGYAQALTDLQATDMDVPQPLLDRAEDGVATLSALQLSFPDLARDALRAARQQDTGGGVTDFLQTQLGLRSLEPREGNDPDAILSRAEAALRDGRLADTLAELEALPEPAIAVLEGWRLQAQTRLATISAVQDLAQTLNTN